MVHQRDWPGYLGGKEQNVSVRKSECAVWWKFQQRFWKGCFRPKELSNEAMISPTGHTTLLWRPSKVKEECNQKSISASERIGSRQQKQAELKGLKYDSPRGRVWKVQRSNSTKATWIHGTIATNCLHTLKTQSGTFSSVPETCSVPLSFAGTIVGRRGM